MFCVDRRSWARASGPSGGLSRFDRPNNFDTDSDSTIGSIAFPAITGSSGLGVGLTLFGFTQADITSISWTLDASTYAVTALDLHALTGDAGCGFGQNCSNSTLSLSATSVSQGGTSCSFDPDAMVGTCESFFEFPIPVSFVLASVAEPSTWAMTLLGFAGLGFAGWRAQRRFPAVAA